MHAHFWKLNAFLNPEMLGLGQKGQFPLHASLLFISLEAEHLGREPDAVSEGRPGGSTVMHPSATENLKMGKSSLTPIHTSDSHCVLRCDSGFSLYKGFSLCRACFFPWADLTTFRVTARFSEMSLCFWSIAYVLPWLLQDTHLKPGSNGWLSHFVTLDWILRLHLSLRLL